MKRMLLATTVAAVAVVGARQAAADCDYADDLSAMSTKAREVDAHAFYTYAVRTSATYECPSYGPDGTLRKTRQTATAHGTAFGYRHDGDSTLLLTNEHVAAWPVVTDGDHPVDGVAAGCKRVSSSLKIVDGDHDNYPNDDIPLSIVAEDEPLDMAILRAPQELAVLPWKVGTSDSLALTNVVEVRGFPLGAFAATNTGKVIALHDHDEQGDWDHDDFVVDALLAHGGSGSPVLAISCKTGEPELVGVFHANYNGGSALNVVVGIDQVRDFMTTLKPTVHVDSAVALDGAARANVVRAASHDQDPPFFPFGGLVASVRVRADGALVFAVFPSDFPRTSRPLLVIEDRPAKGSFGTAGAVYVGGSAGLRPYRATDAESLALIDRTLDSLRRDALTVFSVREAAPGAMATRETFARAEREQRALARMLDGQRDAQQPLVELAGHAPLVPADKAMTLSQIETTAPTTAP
ncbi:MAG TPA: serine protease [Kofleriaceae bacterium]|jgi:serine protease Do